VNRFYRHALIALLFLIPGISCQQNVSDYTYAEQFLPNNVIPMLYNMSVIPNWIDGISNFWYLNEGRGGKEFFIVDAVNATKEPIFDNQMLALALASAISAKVDPLNLPFSYIALQLETVKFKALNKIWQYDRKALTIKEIEPNQAASQFLQSSRYGEAYTINEIRSAKIS
jgi:hypothetical protein